MWSQEVLIGRGLDHRLKKVFQRRRKQISLFSFEGAEALRESKEVRALAPLRRHAEPRTELVRIGVRVHPFPSRTRKLSSLPPKILGGKPPGKAGLANTKESRPAERPAGWPFRFSSCPPRLLFSGGGKRAIYFICLRRPSTDGLCFFRWLFGIYHEERVISKAEASAGLEMVAQNS